MSHLRYGYAAGGMRWLHVAAWISGGLFGLWVGGMALRQYWGVDVLSPVENEISDLLKRLAGGC